MYFTAMQIKMKLNEIDKIVLYDGKKRYKHIIFEIQKHPNNLNSDLGVQISGA